MIVISLITSVFTSIISVWFALKKYRSEKWWDKKLECYQQTVEAMDKILRFCDNRIAEEWFEKEISDEEKSQLKKEFIEGKRLLEKQSNIGKLMLSESACKILSHTDNELYKIEQNFDLQQIADLRETIDCYLSSFIEKAQADLEINGVVPKTKEFLFKRFEFIKSKIKKKSQI